MYVYIQVGRRVCACIHYTWTHTIKILVLLKTVVTNAATGRGFVNLADAKRKDKKNVAFLFKT